MKVCLIPHESNAILCMKGEQMHCCIISCPIFTQTPSVGRWDDTPGRAKGGETPGRGGDTPGTSRGSETPGTARGSETPGAGATPSARIWEATPSYVPSGSATPTGATPGGSTPGHGTSKYLCSFPFLTSFLKSSSSFDKLKLFTPSIQMNEIYK